LVLPLSLPNDGSDVPQLLAQDLLDPGNRVVDRLLRADALGHDAMDRLLPDLLCKDTIVLPVVGLSVWNILLAGWIACSLTYREGI
jgi:hypothetical protein